MNATDRMPLIQETSGEAAVDGLFAGLLAGLASLSLMYVGRLLGLKLSFDSLVWLDPAGVSAWMGAAVQLGLASLFGLLFGVGRWVLRKQGFGLSIEAVGLVYGLVIFLGARAFLLPPEAPAGWFAADYAVYGLALGMAARRELKPQAPRRLNQEDLLMAADE